MTSDLTDLQRRLGDRYRIERQLGQGGMGAVYLARDTSLDRPVALKVLPAEFAAQPDLRDRFLRETRMTAGFSHPNIVPVFSIEDREGVLAYAMGFVEGESLGDRVRRLGPLGAREVVRLLQDVGYALSYAHGRGVVHRDLKPENIMLERATGRALLMDFGIARTVKAVPAATSPSLTRVGEIVGTPEFMSPEQASSDVVDGRSDLYSLGLVAFFAVTGHLAITGDTTQQVLARQLTQPVPPIASLRPDLPGPLAEAIDRLVRKEPSERYQTAEALETALDAAQLAAPEVPLPVRLLAQDVGQLGLVAVFVAVVVVLLEQSTMSRGHAGLDIAGGGLFLLAVLWGRLATSVGAARGVIEAGFAPAEVLAGFGRVLDEHEAERNRLRLLASVRRRRRRSVRVYLVTIATAALLLWVGWSRRVAVGPTQYRVPRPMIIVMISAVVMLGLAFIGLLRNPFRPGIGERLFRLVWLGWPGRAFLRIAARGVEPPRASSAAASVPAAGPETRSVARPAPAHTGQVATAEAAHLARLEARIEALEQWREGDNGSG
jgi:eukaryotic-like serine/threonine-protein kinase